MVELPLQQGEKQQKARHENTKAGGGLDVARQLKNGELLRE
jgi:hypothetical protein